MLPAKPRRPLFIASALSAVLLLGVSLGAVSSHFFSENAKFENFTEELFQSEAASSTLNLHYTLAHPEKYQIASEEITLGTIPKDMESAYAQMKDYENEVQSFDYDKLSQENQLTADLLLLTFHTGRSLGDHYLLEEYLSPSLGIQAQLPVLLAEYAFYDKEDITDYLKLLTCVDDYFQEILAFEEKKSKAGCFMSDITLDRILEQCEAFIENPSDNYLQEIFQDKLEDFSGLSKAEKDQCISTHQNLVENSLVPAYENLIAGLEKLRGTGSNSKGLYYFEGGQDYYRYLLQSQVGVYAPVETIEQRLYQQLSTDYTEMSKLISEDSELIHRVSSEDIKKESHKDSLEKLEVLCTEDFPELKEPEYEVKYVHESMEDFLSPAFYLTPPIDTQNPNTIYINNASQTSNLELFTTLAHEGFPGHLYQTLYFSRENPNPIRSLFTCGGYVEGWATYVESYAYGYADADPKLTRLLWLNRSVNLNLYSLLDIGIHYHGWDLNQTAKYLKIFGIQDEAAVQEIYQYIVETPANYLRYYVGYLGFYDLRDAARQKEGGSFDLKKFHEEVLKIGPVPFPILQKYLGLSS